MRTTYSSRLSFRLRSIGAGAGLALGLFVLFGYAIDFELAWRLAPGLPATHPLSALCLALLGFGLLASLSEWPTVRLVSRGAVVASAAIVAMRLVAPLVGASFFDAMTPFHHVLASQAATNTPIFMGLNTALTLLAIAISEILRWKRWATASQLFACCAMGLLFLALIGYIDHLHAFYGSMAPLTLVGIFVLASSVLFGTHQRGFIRSLVAQSEPGRLARLLLGSSTSVIVVIGWGMTHYTSVFDTTEQFRASLAYQTTAVVTLSWILVTAATARADVIDRRRLCAERQLLKANHKLEDLAARDPLTGLANRRRFEELLQTEHRRAKRSVSPLSLVAVDVDQFKSYNDIYGHPAGDACLKALAKAVDGVLRRPGDLAARIGGEEFLILLPATNAVGASFMAVTIRDAVLDLAIPHRESPVGIVTISIGVATAMPTGDSSHTTLVAAADDALYEAKRNGRNVIQTASAAGIPSAAVTPSLEEKTPYTSPG